MRLKHFHLQEENSSQLRKESNMLLSGKQSRRSISNVASQLCSYNSGISPTIIPAHNDAFRIEFSKFPTDANASPFLCGQEVWIVSLQQQALLLPSKDEESTEIRYPIHRRRIFYPTASFDASKEETKEEQEQEKAESDKVLLENKEQIDASLHCQDELAAMVISGCQSLLGITLENLKVLYFKPHGQNYWVVLVIPDNCTRLEIKSWLNALFGKCNFNAVLLIQVSTFQCIMP